MKSFPATACGLLLLLGGCKAYERQAAPLPPPPPTAQSATIEVERRGGQCTYGLIVDDQAVAGDRFTIAASAQGRPSRLYVTGKGVRVYAEVQRDPRGLRGVAAAEPSGKAIRKDKSDHFTIRGRLAGVDSTVHHVRIWCCKGGNGQQCNGKQPANTATAGMPPLARGLALVPPSPLPLAGGPVMRVEN